MERSVNGRVMDPVMPEWFKNRKSLVHNKNTLETGNVTHFTI